MIQWNSPSQRRSFQKGHDFSGPWQGDAGRGVEAADGFPAAVPLPNIHQVSLAVGEVGRILTCQVLSNTCSPPSFMKTGEVVCVHAYVP